MKDTIIDMSATRAVSDSTIEKTLNRIAPAWPLAHTVAVNPYLGHLDDTLAEASARLARIGGIPATKPRHWYLTAIADGRMTMDDLGDALDASGETAFPSADALLAVARKPVAARIPLPTVAALASEAAGVDCATLVLDRIGAWAESHFDQGQALWGLAEADAAYASWRDFAAHDHTADVLLPGLRARLMAYPLLAEDALTAACDRLGLTDTAFDTYGHQLLLSLMGWAQHARYLLWDAELNGGTHGDLRDLLTIRLVYEAALLDRFEAEIGTGWTATRSAHEAPVSPSDDDRIDALLQEGYDRSAERVLQDRLEAPVGDKTVPAPAVQAIFCIDVRSEVYRRAFETVDPSIRTAGFAGFFGLTVAHRGLASDAVEARRPVLLPAGVNSHDLAASETATTDIRMAARAKRAWKRFTKAAVSSFAFVEAAGPLFATRLTANAMASDSTWPVAPTPGTIEALSTEDAVAAAETVLKAMSLVRDFAPTILLVGHGASVTNNAHASALHCGACGGHAGDVNARLLAGILNRQDVRDGLAGKGIDIPDNTLFLGALHDTTTDTITLFDGDTDVSAHTGKLATLRVWLDQATSLCRAERLVRLSGTDQPRDVVERAADWAEVRPEWALAGCSAFVAAPRSVTAGCSLSGRAFLHDYVWQDDEGFPVLELILTAPVVVASWISLQYYGSTVAPDTFGGGNKLLHNVTGGIGVVEGNRGPLRAGLPWQSVHDGEDFVHDPARLTVCVQAPVDAITDILARHDGVRVLFDKGWLSLYALDDAGRMRWRYAGDLAWSDRGAQKSVAA